MARFILGILLGLCLGAALLAGLVFVRDGNVAALRTIDPRNIAMPRIDIEQIEMRAGDVVPVARRAINRLLPEPSPTRVTVVLNRDGGRLYAGPDHARVGTSSVLMRNQIAALDLPAYRVSDARWRALDKCVRSRFADYRVDVVDEAPASGNYMQVNVGGSPTMLGYQKSTRGLAPYTGRLIPNASVFVFTHGRPTLTELCETAAHELGHALGLDHSRLCSDLMSYGDCGRKAFRDRESRCGEYESRACQDGRERQNSAKKLEDTVGRRPAKPAVV